MKKWELRDRIAELEVELGRAASRHEQLRDSVMEQAIALKEWWLALPPKDDTSDPLEIIARLRDALRGHAKPYDSTLQVLDPAGVWELMKEEHGYLWAVRIQPGEPGEKLRDLLPIGEPKTVYLTIDNGHQRTLALVLQPSEFEFDCYEYKEYQQARAVVLTNRLAEVAVAVLYLPDSMRDDPSLNMINIHFD
jgi:hypothetical protein